MQLNQFPEMQNARSSRLTIPSVWNNKEKLLITYDLTYDTRGSKLTLSNYLVTNAVKNDDLKISI